MRGTEEDAREEREREREGEVRGQQQIIETYAFFRCAVECNDGVCLHWHLEVSQFPRRRCEPTGELMAQLPRAHLPNAECHYETL